MQKIFLYILLGIIQGLTEFFPISSSGHLVLLQNIFGLKRMISFDIVVHSASFLVILLVFRERIKFIIQDLIREAMNKKNTAGKEGELTGFKFLILLLFAIIPTVAVVLVFQSFLEGTFESTKFLWACFLITGFILYATKDKAGQRIPKVLDSLIVGILQGVAVIPGISRPGITISACLCRRIDRNLAIDFSFLLGGLAILSAIIYKFNDILLIISDKDEFIPLTLGFLSAFISSYFALNVIIRHIRNAKLYRFAYYCWAMGIINFIIFIASVSKI